MHLNHVIDTQWLHYPTGLSISTKGPVDIDLLAKLAYTLSEISDDQEIEEA